MRAGRGGLRLAAAAVLFALCAPLLAQQHERAFGPYVLRASVAKTSAVSPERAEAHGIERGSNRALLNVIVYRTDDPLQMPLRAKVEAFATGLAGVRQNIELREIAANNRISYTGSFEYLPQEVMDFTINAQPADSDRQATLQFQERLWVRR